MNAFPCFPICAIYLVLALEKEIEEKEREMAEFSKVTAEMESSRERDFKQLQLNRENIDRFPTCVVCISLFMVMELIHTCT